MRTAKLWFVLHWGVLVGCSASANSGGSATAGAAGLPSTGGVTATGGSGASTAGGTGSTSTGGSGTGGSAGGPEHIMGKCDGLGAIDQFEDVTPLALSGGTVTKVVADAVNTGTLYAGTDKHGVLRSLDCGATWTKINTGRGADVLDGGTVWYLAIDPVDSNLLFASALYSSDASLYRSTNGGVDWDSLSPPGSLIASTVEYNFFQWASMDPTDHRHLLLSFHANCSGPTGPECLAETQDSGSTWRLFKGPLGGWGEGVGPIILSSDTFLLGSSQAGIYFTNDAGSTWERVGPGIHGIPYKSVTGDYYSGSDYGTLHSSDGHDWAPIPNADRTFEVLGDGTRMFASVRDLGSPGQPYYTSLETDGKTWTKYPSPTMAHGAVSFAYDADHHVLYSANTESGLWRLVTR